MKQMNSRHSNIITFNTTSLARRALLLLSLFVMSVGSAWGATKVVDKYVKWDQTSAVFNVSDAYSQLGKTLSELKAAHRIDWYVLNESSVKQTIKYGGTQSPGVWTFYAYHNYEFWPYTAENGDTNVYLDNNTNYYSQGDLESGWTSWNLSRPTIFAPSGGTFETYKNYTVICEVSAETSPSEVGVRYVFHFNATGNEPDDFVGTPGAKVSKAKFISGTETTTTIDFSDVLTKLPGVKYARYYLTLGGEAQDISATAITVTGGTAETIKTKHGVYVYTGSALTAENLSITVTTTDPLVNYQVEAVFSDDDPDTYTGTTVTKEPSTLDYKYTYKFLDTDWAGTLSSSAFSHSKEILVANESVTSASMPLSSSLSKILTEYGKSDFATLATSLHLRWYVVKNDGAGNYEMIANSEDYLAANTSTYGHKAKEGFGLYWNTSTHGISWPLANHEFDKVFDVTFTKPVGDNWENYKVYVVMSDDLSDQTTSGAVLTKEPSNLNMVYSFSFFVETAFQFVHSKGASGREYITSAIDSRIAATVPQYNWNNDTSTKESVSGDVRQGVHTVEYDLYVDPTSSDLVDLKLPFQGYISGEGSPLEPMAYIRWYNWNTDMNDSKLSIAGSSSETYLEDLQEIISGSPQSRGFFMLNNQITSLSPNKAKVGVQFNPNGLTSDIIIACDVSKYYDGIYQGSETDTRIASVFSGKQKPYMMHEPTLSIRYIFNIHPASQIATAIKDGATKLAAKGTDMFDLFENNGRVVVSVKDVNTRFVVRADLPTLNNYFIYDVSDNLVKCNKVDWYAYLEDEAGVWENSTVLSPDMSAWSSYQTERVTAFKMNSLNGNYTLITDPSKNKVVTAEPGMRFHLVGYIGDGTTSAPAIHYELNLFDAPVYAIENLPLERTEDYLKIHMTHQATVNFDDKMATKTLNSQAENQTELPLAWDEAQYGFCYPDIDNYRIYTTTDDGLGLSPLHGDYILLKSMNDTYSAKGKGPYYKYHWWNTEKLDDYTYTYKGNTEYGAFLYIDASEESRTIAKMNFTANLCSGSELCFTAAIADMTESGKLNPQVMASVYAVDGSNNRTRLVSFLSSELSTVVSGSYALGQWYQIYGKTTIPEGISLAGVDHYEVVIDNYSRHTDGADYCVDQLMFYTSTAKLKVKQSGINCGDVKVPLNLYVEAEQIEGMGGKTIFWRVCDKDGNALTDASLYNNGGLLYAETSVPATVVPVAEASLPYPGSGYFTGSDGKVYFSLANQGFALKEGENYYISVYNMYETSVSHESLWGNPANECSVFSQVFIPKVMYLTMEDAAHNIVTSLPGGCSDKKANVALNVILNMPDDNEVSGFKKYDNVHYDYFLGTLAEAKAYKITVGSDDYYLVDALADYRNRDGSGSDTYKIATTLEAGYETANKNYYDVINKAIGEGKLFLSYSSKCNVTVTGDADNKAYISAFPAEEKVNNGISDFLICSPLEYVFDINVSGNAPSLTLGFEDVTTYPSGIRVVRVGLEQLTNMQKADGFILHIPVNTFKKNDTAIAKDGTLEILGDLDLLAYSAAANQTNDNQITANIKVATFEANDISNTQMYVSVNFHGVGVTKPTFHEGFAYRMFFQFKDKDGGVGACEGNAEFLLKVVPKYVTWNDGTVTTAANTNDNWSNDANWSRSSKAELYSTTYQDNTDINASLTPTPATYVPMKFTYVTIPTGNVAPKLINLAKGTDGIYNNIGTDATSNIHYDMMVKVENECGHSVSGDIYDCEKFYSNICKEIYFKPSAELINQQYLTYEKAWVEKEMISNKWYLLSAPLKETYAGDMYVPKANGLQDTEAFQSITFGDGTGAYSRTKYPIYQRSWGKEHASTVYTQTADVYRSDYSANLGYNTWSGNVAEWRHTFNDVNVNYTALTGFSIRAHKQDKGTALLRLPKDDASYSYYDYSGTTQTGAASTFTKTTADIGKFVTAAGDANLTLTITDAQEMGGYVLVGNPYMASLDMQKFFDVNTGLTGAYYTYEASSASTHTTSGVIRPLQAFFVQKGTATQINFTADMMMDGNHGTATPAPSPSREFTLTATSNRGQSTASVSMGEEEKSVETLFDSNIADVPVVYTVANGQAVSINQVTDLKPVAFGVNCNSNDFVDVTFSDIEQLTDGDVFVVDAVDGKTQQIYEGDTFSIQPNDYGRYFLTFAGGTTGVEEVADVQKGIVISVRGKEVIVTSTEGISQVRALSLNGATMYQDGACGTFTSFTLAGGVYIIKAENSVGKQQIAKIIVK